MELLEIEENTSQAFYVAFLNNIRALIKIYDRLVQKN